MGYTHYWSKNKNTLAEDKLLELRGHLDLVLRKHKNTIQFEEDIAQSPELYIDWSNNIVCVRFNGKGDDAHETFSFDDRDNFNFCKTARKPYDAAVSECLLLLNHYLDIELSSDGWSNYQPDKKYKVGNSVKSNDIDGSWYIALKKVNKILGTKYKFVVDSVYGTNDCYFSYKLKIN